MTTAAAPFFVETLRLYRTLSTRVSIYATVFVLSTATAMLLDLRLGVSPGTVLIYTTGLVGVLMLAVPAAFIVVRRFLSDPLNAGAFNHAFSTSIDLSLFVEAIDSLMSRRKDRGLVTISLKELKDLAQGKIGGERVHISTTELRQIQVGPSTSLHLALLERQYADAQMSPATRVLVNRLLETLYRLNDKEGSATEHVEHIKALDELTMEIVRALHEVLPEFQSIAIRSSTEEPPSLTQTFFKDGIQFFKRR